MDSGPSVLAGGRQPGHLSCLGDTIGPGFIRDATHRKILQPRYSWPGCRIYTIHDEDTPGMRQTVLECLESQSRFPLSLGH